MPGLRRQLTNASLAKNSKKINSFLKSIKNFYFLLNHCCCLLHVATELYVSVEAHDDVKASNQTEQQSKEFAGETHLREFFDAK